MSLASTTTKPKEQVILGLDPGLARLGFAVLKRNFSSPIILDVGCFETDKKMSTGERLNLISDKIIYLIEKYKPDAVAVEKLFFSKNVKTALTVAEARGVIIYTASTLSCKIFEFSPQEVKIAATGQGRADKAQVQKMLKIIFKLKQIPKPDDAADALALALCGLYKT